MFRKGFVIYFQSHYFLYLDPSLKICNGLEVMHIVKDYNYNGFDYPNDLCVQNALWRRLDTIEILQIRLD